MQEANKLWYVRAQDTNGDDMDLLVVAATEQRARQLWREYYESTVEEGDLLLEHFPDIDWVGPVPGVTPDPGPERAIPWAEIQADEIARREGADAG